MMNVELQCAEDRRHLILSIHHSTFCIEYVGARRSSVARLLCEHSGGIAKVLDRSGNPLSLCLDQVSAFCFSLSLFVSI